MCTDMCLMYIFLGDWGKGGKGDKFANGGKSSMPKGSSTSGQKNEQGWCLLFLDTKYIWSFERHDVNFVLFFLFNRSYWYHYIYIIAAKMVIPCWIIAEVKKL